MITAVQFYAHAQSFKDAYAAAMRPLCQRLELSQTAMDILLFLANNPSMDTARDICTYRHLKPALVSFHIDALTQNGLLQRRSAPDDRRKLHLTCTEKAAPIIAQGQAIQEEFSRQLTQGLSPEQLEILAQCFSTIEQNIARLPRVHNREKGDL